MKTAIIHDWLVVDAGAEKVLSAMLELYPDADVYALVDFLSDSDREAVLGGRYAKTSFIQHLPFAREHFRNYLPLFPTAIERFDLSVYDLIISSSWAVAKGVKTTKDQKHICYCHTPIRYAWDLYEEYTANLPLLKKQLVQATLAYIRRWDKKSSARVDSFIANSAFVAERIERIYGRKACIVHPPVDIESFALCAQKNDYYLTASRLVGYKKVDLIVEAFNQMPHKKLVVIGGGEEFERISALAKDNIVMLGHTDRTKMIEYMQNARAFVYAALEDFGIVPIEAMACGTPIIAYGVGGVRESVMEGIGGVFFAEQSVIAIKDAVLRFESESFSPQLIRDSVLRFDKQRFIEEMRQASQILG